MPDEHGNITIPDVMAVQGWEQAPLGTTDDLAAARARVAELEAENARLTEALKAIKAEGDCNGGSNAQLERRAFRECCAIAIAALADGAQTEAPAEGEEG